MIWVSTWSELVFNCGEDALDPWLSWTVVYDISMIKSWLFPPDDVFSLPVSFLVEPNPITLLTYYINVKECVFLNPFFLPKCFILFLGQLSLQGSWEHFRLTFSNGYFLVFLYASHMHTLLPPSLPPSLRIFLKFSMHKILVKENLVANKGCCSQAWDAHCLRWLFQCGCASWSVGLLNCTDNTYSLAIPQGGT